MKTNCHYLPVVGKYLNSFALCVKRKCVQMQMRINKYTIENLNINIDFLMDALKSSKTGLKYSAKLVQRKELMTYFRHFFHVKQDPSFFHFRNPLLSFIECDGALLI